MFELQRNHPATDNLCLSVCHWERSRGIFLHSYDTNLRRDIKAEDLGVALSFGKC